MAARRGKSQARRNGGNSNPPWMWLGIGLVLGVVLIVGVPKLMQGNADDGFFRPKPNPDARPVANVSAEDDEADEHSEQKSAPGFAARRAPVCVRRARRLGHAGYILSGAPTPSSARPLASTWRVAAQSARRAFASVASSTRMRSAL